jgi:tetratricopeptide (TPR) repeat protein
MSRLTPLNLTHRSYRALAYISRFLICVGKPSIVVSLLFFISLAQVGKKSAAGTVESKSGVALEQEAITEFREAIRLKPDNLFAHYKLGLAYVEAGRYAEGEATCEGALAITRGKQPGEFDLSNLLTCLGEAKFRLGKDDEAINAFKRVAEMNPKIFDVQIRLAHSLIRKGANDEAISVLQECLTLEPKNANVPYILAGVYLTQGHLDGVIPNLKSAIKLDSNFAAAYFALGMAYSSIGDKQAAMKEYRTLKKLDPQLAEQLLSNINQ